MAPFPSPEACQWCSPESMITAPRLRAFEPEETVQRARRRGAAAWSWSDIGLPPWGRGVVFGRRDGFGVRRREVALVAAPQFGAGFPDGVLQRVGEGAGRRRDDVGVTA